MAEPLTYAKVYGPPDTWYDCRIFDLDTGEEIDRVLEVNAAEGWVIRFAVDANGHPIRNGDDWARERLDGRFEIRRP